jgi:hypothetical protein
VKKKTNIELPAKTGGHFIQRIYRVPQRNIMVSKLMPTQERQVSLPDPAQRKTVLYVRRGSF